MMRSEFIELTGFEPTPEEYSQIEERYMSDAELSKEDFCRAFIADGEDRKLYAARAAKIAALEDRLQEESRRHCKTCLEYEDRIDRLRAALEKEEEWKPVSDCGTQLSEEKYQDLLKSGICEFLTEEAAIDLVYNECGFDRSKVRLVECVNTYEVNRHQKLRKAASFARKPLYASSDWNYVRFNCQGWQYELINGQLFFYES